MAFFSATGWLSLFSLSLSLTVTVRFELSLFTHVWYLPTGQWPASRPRRQCFAACDTGCPHARSVDTYKASFARSPPSRPANAPLRATFDRRLATTRRPRRHRANARLQCRDAAAGAGGWVLGRGRGREREQGGLDSLTGRQASRQAGNLPPSPPHPTHAKIRQGKHDRIFLPLGLVGPCWLTWVLGSPPACRRAAGGWVFGAHGGRRTGQQPAERSPGHPCAPCCRLAGSPAAFQLAAAAAHPAASRARGTARAAVTIAGAAPRSLPELGSERVRLCACQAR